MKRVLIATSRSGAGHTSVAAALSTAFSQLYPGQLVPTVVDPFLGPFLSEGGASLWGRFQRLYAPTIVGWPAVWGLFYRLTDQPWLLGLTLPRVLRLLEGRARRIVEETQPDVVLSVHPICHHLMAPVLPVWPRPVPQVVVLTDLVCVHSAWTTPLVDLYLAPTKETERALRQAGIGPDRIRQVGLPIDPRFGQVGDDVASVRRRLGLEVDRFTVLLVGGGEGAGGLERAARAIGLSGLAVQLLVVCGRNHRLQRRLEAARLGVPARVWGFVENMPELMGAADVVVTKAGSVSLAEALAAGRPILIVQAIPGQETGNPGFVESRGAGKAVGDPQQLVAELASLQADPQRRAAIAACARAAGQPEAAHAAAIEVARLLKVPALAMSRR